LADESTTGRARRLDLGVPFVERNANQVAEAAFRRALDPNPNCVTAH